VVKLIGAPAVTEGRQFDPRRRWTHAGMRGPIMRVGRMMSEDPRDARKSSVSWRRREHHAKMPPYFLPATPDAQSSLPVTLTSDERK
jgi:hypothetical protein